jgi:hypothetical protein
VDKDAVNEFRHHVSSRYEARTGRQPEIYVTEAGPGAGRIA